MAPELGDRYQSMGEIIEELDKMEGVGSSTAIPATPEDSEAEAEAVPEDVPLRPHRVAKAAPAKPKGEAQGVGKERRARSAVRKPSSMVPLLLFLCFVAVAAGVIYVLLAKMKEKEASRRDTGRAVDTTTRGATDAAPVEPSKPPPPTETPVSARPAPKEPEKEKAPAEVTHGRSLFGRDGEFLKDAGD